LSRLLTWSRWPSTLTLRLCTSGTVPSFLIY
jgi:hypothetical protein